MGSCDTTSTVKTLWMEVISLFSALVTYKRRLVQTLINGVEKDCTKGRARNEEGFIKRNLLTDDHSENFTEHYGRLGELSKRPMIIERKPGFIALPFIIQPD